MVSYFCIICIIIFKYLSQLKQRQMKKNTLGGWQLKNREKQKRWYLSEGKGPYFMIYINNYLIKIITTVKN